MSMMINPNIILLMDPQLPQVASWSRGALRNVSEHVGLGISVPKTRKMDYIFRDMLMAITGTYIIENTFKIVEQAYITPNFVRFLKLDKLKDWYTPHDVHTPDFMRSAKIQNLQTMPSAIAERMYGSHINKDSFYLIPDLMEQQTIPALENKLKRLGTPPANWREHLSEIKYWFVTKPPMAEAQKELEAKIQHTRFLAHHMRRMVSPEQYIDKYLLASGKITPTEAALMQRMIKQANKVAKQFERVQQFLQKDLKGPSLSKRVMHFMFPSMKESAQAKTKALLANNVQAKALVELIHQLSQNPAFNARKAKFFGPLVSMCDKKLLDEMRGPTFLRDIFKVGPMRAINNTREHQYVPHRIMEAINNEAMVPWIEEAAKNLPRERRELIERLTSGLVKGKINMARLTKVLKSADLYLKIPFSVIAMFVIYGILANNFEAKYLLPFQRHVVRKKGNSRDFMLPGYLCPLPAGAVFYLANKLPFIQKLGHTGSFMVSGFAGLATMFATAWLGFLYMYKHTPPDKSKSKPVVQNPFSQSLQQSPLPAAPSPHP